jgi:regulator of ribonuclease activity B
MDRRSKLLGHRKRNEQLLRTFIEKQVNLDQLRPVELHFWASRQPDSVNLGHELYKRGFRLLMLNPASLGDDRERWNIEAGTMTSISNVTSEEFTETLIDVAATFGAEYDGWGTSI